MICRNCGFENALTDAFCGSCGQFLQWDRQQGSARSDAAGGRSEDETSFHARERDFGDEQAAGAGPYRLERAARRAARHAGGPRRMARPAAPGVTYGTIICWNCGRRNQPSRAFCQRCGERLSVASLAGGRRAAREESGRARLLALGLGTIAVVLLGAAILFGGAVPGPSPTPTGGAVVTASPAATPPQPTLPPVSPSPAPTETPTDAPSQPPSEPPATPPPTTAPATPVNCSSSTVPTRWANLSASDTRVRVRREEAWCIHQVVIVPDPNFGHGTIRLTIGDSPLVVVTHGPDSGSGEYPHAYAPAHLVPPRTNVSFSMTCAEGDFCNAVIQVGYELLGAP